MRSLMTAGRTLEFPDKPWLVLGKGPSIDLYKDHAPEDYNVLALNHTVTLGRCAIAHAIDLEVIRDCGEAIDRNAQVLVMPERPHIGMTQGAPIRGHYASHPLLLKLDEDDRLLTYTKVALPVAAAPLGTIPVRFFSGEAAFGVLAALGVKKVFTLGIDGGRKYGETFSSLRPLENGRKDFDESINAIYELCSHHRMSWTRLGGPVRA